MAKAKLQKPAESKVTLQLSIEEAGDLKDFLEDVEGDSATNIYWSLVPVLEEAGVKLDAEAKP